jgi:fumarate reductase flavoprotein subunit
MGGEEADLICIGAGFAGLTAALRACELGRTAIVLERQSEPKQYNNSRITTGVFHVASNDVRLPPEKLIEAINTETQNYAKPDLVHAVATTAARVVDWLIGHGVALENEKSMAYVAGRAHLVLMPARAMRAGLDWHGKGGDRTLGVLEDKLVNLGGRIIRGAEAAKLVMAEGRCVGIDVRQHDVMHRYTAKAVVIADGGFQANLAMLKDTVTPEPTRIRVRATPSGTGDGIRMARDAGAHITEIGAFYGHVQAIEAMHDDRLWPYPNIDAAVTGAILVDGAGRRFVDEGRGAVFVTNAIAKLADPLSATVVFSCRIWDDVASTGVSPPNPEMTKNGGTLIEAPDLAALAAKIGVPADALTATVAAYNAAHQNGALAGLTPVRTERKAKAHVIEAPYCAIKVCAGVTNTMGGIDIDAHTHVLGGDGAVIAGLYAAGSSTGGLEGGPNVGYVGGIVKAFVLGLRAGEAAARDTQ